MSMEVAKTCSSGLQDVFTLFWEQSKVRQKRRMKEEERERERERTPTEKGNYNYRTSTQKSARFRPSFSLLRFCSLLCLTPFFLKKKFPFKWKLLPLEWQAVCCCTNLLREASAVTYQTNYGPTSLLHLIGKVCAILGKRHDHSFLKINNATNRHRFGFLSEHLMTMQLVYMARWSGKYAKDHGFLGKDSTWHGTYRAWNVILKLTTACVSPP